MNFQESTTILNARTKKSGNLLKAPRIWLIDGILARITTLSQRGIGSNDQKMLQHTPQRFTTVINQWMQLKVT